MSKKIVKKILWIVFIILILIVVIINTGVTISGRCQIYVDNYNKFYLYKQEFVIRPFLNIGVNGSVGAYKIWFLPGQKKRLLKEIKKEVETDLKSAIPGTTGVLKKYTISDDFKKIYIYYDKFAYEFRGGNYLPEGLANEISYKVELYHELKNGYGNSEIGNVINMVETEE